MRSKYYLSRTNDLTRPRVVTDRQTKNTLGVGLYREGQGREFRVLLMMSTSWRISIFLRETLQRREVAASWIVFGGYIQETCYVQGSTTSIWFHSLLGKCHKLVSGRAMETGPRADVSALFSGPYTSNYTAKERRRDANCAMEAHFEGWVRLPAQWWSARAI